MVGVYCSVKNCSFKNGSKHRFPNPQKDLNRFDVWVSFCGNNELESTTQDKIYSNCRICSGHFLPKDFGRNNVLLKTAVPSIYEKTPTLDEDPAHDVQPTSSSSAINQEESGENHFIVLYVCHLSYLLTHCNVTLLKSIIKNYLIICLWFLKKYIDSNQLRH